MNLELMTLRFCAAHPETPLVAKLMALAIVAYALSPIDLIPDFVPVLGYLDDLILVPLGILLTLKLVPPPILEICRQQAIAWSETSGTRPKSWIAAAVVVILWIAFAVLAWRMVPA